MDLPEYIISTQATPDCAQPAAIVWDCNTGNVLFQFKCNSAIKTNCLAIVNGSHIVAAEHAKALLHVWPLNSRESDSPEDNKKLILPNAPNAICLDPDNELLAIGIGLQVYVWMLNTGCLVSVQQNHYQSVSCVRMYEDYLLAGGADGFLVVYNITDLINLGNTDVPALYIKSDHSLGITDICVNNFGAIKARFVTTSCDQTARIYELATGRILLTIINPEPITTVVCHVQFSAIYLGTHKGNIYSVDLKNPPRGLETHNEPSEKNKNQFTGGHAKPITSLSISLNSQTLASASGDCFVFIWNISSRQVMRKIEHKFVVTNVRFVPIFSNGQKVKSQFTIKTLGRHVENNYYMHVHCINQTKKSVFDDEVANNKKHVISAMQVELDQANTLNNRLYGKLLEFLKETRKNA